MSLFASCAIALFMFAGQAGDTELVCAAEGEQIEHNMQNAAGWYNGYTDTVYVMYDMSLEYTIQVLEHELAHAWDLKKGTELNGYPSYFSETHTGFDVEQFARLQTLWMGEWPEGEEFPDVIPTEDEWSRMEAAGWLKAERPIGSDAGLPHNEDTPTKGTTHA